MVRRIRDITSVPGEAEKYERIPLTHAVLDALRISEWQHTRQQ
jgi:hypothetical protein